MVKGMISNAYQSIWGTQNQTPIESTKEALERLDRRLNGYFWERSWCLSSTLYEVQNMNRCLTNLSAHDWEEGGLETKVSDLQEKVKNYLTNRGGISGILAFFSKLLNTYWNQEFLSSDVLGLRLLQEARALAPIKISLNAIKLIENETTTSPEFEKLLHPNFLSSMALLLKEGRMDSYQHSIDQHSRMFLESDRLKHPQKLAELNELIDLIEDESILSLPSNEKKIAMMLGYESDEHLRIVYDIGSVFLSKTLSQIMTGETFEKCCAILSLLPPSEERARGIALSLPFYLSRSNDGWKDIYQDLIELMDSDFKEDALGFMIALAIKHSDIPFAIKIAASLTDSPFDEESCSKKVMIEMCIEFAPEESKMVIEQSDLPEKERSYYLKLCENYQIVHQNLLKEFSEIISLSNPKEKQEKFAELSGKIVCKGAVRTAIKQFILETEFPSEDGDPDFWFAEMASVYYGNNEILEGLTFTLKRSESENKDEELLFCAKKLLDFHEVELAKQSLRHLSAGKKREFEEILTRLENVLPIREEIDQIAEDLFDLID